MWKNVGVIILALGVLFVSLTMAELKIWALEDNEDKIRVGLIQYRMVEKNGDIVSREYKLPEVTVLPSSPFYGFKQLRDWLWIQFTNDPIQKARIVMLVADKKIVEARKLFGDNLSRKGLEASIEATDKLKYAHNLISNQKEQTPLVKQIKEQIMGASYAYREIILEASGSFEMETGKYEKLVKDITDFNEAQKEASSFEDD